MAELTDLRKQIDEIDSQIFELFGKRAEVSEGVAAYKREHGMRVFDPAREQQKVADAAARVPEDLGTYGQVLMELLMEASRARQHELLGDAAESDLVARIEAARASTAEYFSKSARVACQGVEGAYSQVAAEKLFRRPSIRYLKTFDQVFDAVEAGEVDYGVLPLENSTAGSVSNVVALLGLRKVHIVRSTRVKVDHCLLAKKGTALEDVREIYSHEQAIRQSGTFLEALRGVSVTACVNTAVAARMVAESERGDTAALSSRDCAELYGLEVVESAVQDRDNNYTRFVCVARDLEIYPGADRTSFMLETAHRPGSLYKFLAKFYALDINIIKLESRPIPERDFDFDFYFEIDCPVAAPEFTALMSTVEGLCSNFRYLGSYTEAI